MAKTMQETFAGLDVDRIMRRGDKDVSSASKIPTDLFQIAVFYSRPVKDELDLNGLNTLTWKKKANNSLFIFPFYSKEIFTVQTDAINYIPYFIRQLISDGRLPTEVINEDKSINDNLIKPAIVPLEVVFLERDNEFKV
jgi:hypothetical protein